ncbi:FAD-dependent monooxygenase [Oscillatoria amoena NRMC-F 0135]|nr:FAD-dependent monooxygenase [Oscillatoria amoena NRMC-F 0135]
MKQVAIIGGGLGGLIAANWLANNGIPVILFEKKAYPFNRVCGEYVSNEALPFLKQNGWFPRGFDLPSIKQFKLSAVTGKSTTLPLDLGGFGISRYTFDHFLAQKAKQSGVQLFENCEVSQLKFENNRFTIQTNSKSVEADVVIGSFGKRSRLDVQFNRTFTKKRSPYVGVKYHILTEHPADSIALHNFSGGYLGISNIEAGKTNICYLVHRSRLRKFGNIQALEENLLFKNPLIKSIYSNSTFLFEKPEVINEFSFAPKEPVFNHMLMVGDAAGLITPLCGNGMAMAIHSAWLAAELVYTHIKENQSREWLENQYAYTWRKNFQNRLRFGRLVQHYLFGSSSSSNAAVHLAIHFKGIARQIIKRTHGNPF